MPVCSRLPRNIELAVESGIDWAAAYGAQVEQAAIAKSVRRMSFFNWVSLGSCSGLVPRET